jgi:1-deoxy-D-xylulose-5-phosphate reductoisomerase
MVAAAPQTIAILGSTGSIGRSTLDVIARHPERYRVIALTGNSNVELLARQCSAFGARYAVTAEPGLADELRDSLARHGCTAGVLAGQEGLREVAGLAEVETVMAAIVGAAGLGSSLHAARCGKRLLLANKESMVIAGHLFVRAARESGATIIPVDSEHNALFQALPAGFEGGLEAAGVERLILTASGGPFLERSASELAAVTPEEACAHPNWNMGRKISVDSATLMNKGLEVIEAHWLFSASPGQISVVIHPQSIVHSMVVYRDGSVLAQLGMPDMRTPIAHALAWPDRIESGVERLDLTEMANLEFHTPDTDRFPCLQLAFQALEAGDSAAIVLNAANEVAVEAFLERRIGFNGIPTVIARTLDERPAGSIDSLEEIQACDAAARGIAQRMVEDHG